MAARGTAITSELDGIVEAWPRLSPAAKAAILSVFDAVRPSGLCVESPTEGPDAGGSA